jgi:hypothetical protein
MGYLNEQETRDNILKPRTDYIEAQEQRDKDTLATYEILPSFEQIRIITWLKLNLSRVPVTPGVKNIGLQDLWSGDHQSKESLILIRFALREMSGFIF